MERYMKISKIEHWIVDKWMIIRLTDENGVSGLGEGNFWSYGNVMTTILDQLSEDLSSPIYSPDYLFNQLYRKYSFRSPALTAVLSAIDMAIWDIRAKEVNLPLWDLLGGKVRTKIKAMLLLGGYGKLETKEDFVSQARKAFDDGYRAIKFTPFPKNWAKLSYGKLISECTDIVGSVREEVGMDMDLGIEIHRNMQPSESIVFAQNIEEFLPYFYEDPIAPDSVFSMKEIGESINIPLALGERNNTIWEFREYAMIPNVLFLRPDVGLAGGITNIKKIAAVAESFHQRIIPHNFLGPISNLITIHLAASLINWDVNEAILPGRPSRENIVTYNPTIKDGYIEIPEHIGIGTELIDSELGKYPFNPGDGETEIRDDWSIALR